MNITTKDSQVWEFRDIDGTLEALADINTGRIGFRHESDSTYFHSAEHSDLSLERIEMIRAFWRSEVGEKYQEFRRRGRPSKRASL